MRKQKRGVIGDLAFWASAGLIMAVISVTGYMILQQFSSAIDSIDTADNETVKSVVNTYADRYDNVMDSGIVFAIIAGHLGIIVLAIALRTHPALWAGLFIFLMLITIMAGYFSNAWDSIVSDPVLVTYGNDFTMTGWVLDNYLLITLLLGFIDIIAFLSTGRLLEAGG